MSREFQIFAKPTGAECNLHCRYCYYIDKKDIYPPERLLMDDDILELYVRQNIEAFGDGPVTFSWHGGEPLMAGIEFFRRAVKLQKKYNTGKGVVLNGIQTNGTLINEDWCRFLRTEKFIVGISIDGPAGIHNCFRTNRDGRPSYEKVMNGFRLLKKHAIVPEILCVVNAINVREPIAVYNFFRSLDIKYITFLPLVEKIADAPGMVSDISVPSPEFGKFLSTIFDEWIKKDIGKIKIQIFEEAIRIAFKQDHTLCIFKENCGGVPVLEHNGDFYSCDHYVDKPNLVGNIMHGSIAEFLDSEKQKSFGRLKSETLPHCCTGCEVKAMCNGECPKNRFLTSPDGEPGLNYLCNGYRYFFNHCRPFVDAVAAMSQIMNQPPD